MRRPTLPLIASTAAPSARWPSPFPRSPRPGVDPDGPCRPRASLQRRDRDQPPAARARVPDPGAARLHGLSRPRGATGKTGRPGQNRRDRENRENGRHGKQARPDPRDRNQGPTGIVAYAIVQPTSPMAATLIGASNIVSVSQPQRRRLLHHARGRHRVRPASRPSRPRSATAPGNVPGVIAVNAQHTNCPSAPYEVDTYAPGTTTPPGHRLCVHDRHSLICYPPRYPFTSSPTEA